MREETKKLLEKFESQEMNPRSLDEILGERCKQYLKLHISSWDRSLINRLEYAI